jgi:hypothetical protein
MKILKTEELEEGLSERMNEHPLGWRHFYTVNKKGHYGLGFVNKILNIQYWLKFPSIYSSRAIGFESTLDEELPFLNDPYFNRDFGFRSIKISEKEMGRVRKSGRIIGSVWRKIQKAMRSPPEPYSGYGIIGPYPNRVLKDLDDISPAQMELEIKMQEEIEKFEKRNTNYII